MTSLTKVESRLHHTGLTMPLRQHTASTPWKNTLTDKDADLLHKVKDQYYHDFSRLVGTTLNKVPRELQDYLLVMLEDESSAHGSNFEAFMDAPPPRIQAMRDVIKNAGKQHKR